ncbi:MAG TPA: ABC transporter ATP-binding protein [Xanthobacteraceae bacterium]
MSTGMATRGIVTNGAVTPAPRSPAPASAAGAGISFDAVTVAYRGAIVLESFSLEVRHGEIMALIGPSGSGKTTALRAVAGFVRPLRGRVRIGGVDCTDQPPYARGIGMVVQNYALFPHMRVARNVAFGLRARKAPRDLIAQRVEECLRLVGMAEFKNRYPRELSGGQQQRVAIARALAVKPAVLLLDEPLSALDAQIRRAMVEELAALHRNLPDLTVLYVTHDQSEALTLADRIAVMRDGRLVSLGASQALYRHPPNRFTAEFLGRANLLPVRLESSPVANGHLDVSFAGTRLRISTDGASTVGASTVGASTDGAVRSGNGSLVCIRPHALHLAEGDSGNRLSGTVASVQWQGDHHAITLDCHGIALRMVMKPLREPPERGARLDVAFSPDDATLIGEGTEGHG